MLQLTRTIPISLRAGWAAAAGLFTLLALILAAQQGLFGTMAAAAAAGWDAEDGPLENGTALFAALAALLWAGAGRALDGHKRKAAFAVALVLAFFAAEEISWGQRLLGFDTPATLAETNRQGEFNLHNVGVIHDYKDGLLALGIAVWGVALPMLVLRWPHPAIQGLLPPPAPLVGFFAAAIAYRAAFKPIYGNVGQEGLEFLFALAMLLTGWAYCRASAAR